MHEHVTPTSVEDFGVRQTSAAMSTTEYLMRWMTSRRSLRASTMQAYYSHIRVHLVPHIGHIPLEHLTRTHIEAMYDSLLGEESRLSIASVHRVHSALNSALNHAVQSGLIPVNPARLVDLPRIPTSRPRPWTGEELAQFLHRIEDIPLHPLFALLGLRGLRRGEAIALRWANVNLQTCEIHVREQFTLGSVTHEVGPPKSKAGIRTVAIDETLAELLAQHSVAQREAGIESEFVFTDRNGRPFKPAFVTRYFEFLVRQTGSRRIRLHDLRHTSATLGLASGETLLEVSRRLGHSSVSITADIYTEVPPETAHASAERLATYLRTRTHN